MDKFVAGLVCGAILTFAITCLAKFVSVILRWKRAFMSGAKVSMLSIIGMRMRGCPPQFLVDAYCALVHSGHDVTIQQVESCYISRKHEISENNIGAFIDMLREFVGKDDDGA
jgi:uncharacterized protein YqfA (UPF0365 family)